MELLLEKNTEKNISILSRFPDCVVLAFGTLSCIRVFTLKNIGSQLASMVQLKTFNIHETFQLGSSFFIVEKCYSK